MIASRSDGYDACQGGRWSDINIIGAIPDQTFTPANDERRGRWRNGRHCQCGAGAQDRTVWVAYLDGVTTLIGGLRAVDSQNSIGRAGDGTATFFQLLIG